MNDEIIEKVLSILREVGSIALEGGKVGFSYIVHGIFVISLTWSIIAIVMLAFSMWGLITNYITLMKASKNQRPSRDANVVMFIISLIVAVIAIFLLASNIPGVFAPEYYAVLDILSYVK